MNSMKRPRYLPALASAVIVALAASNCSTDSKGSDKAGGQGEPVVLRMATVNGDLAFTPQIAYLADRVEELSGRTLRIEMVYEVQGFADNAEQAVVHDVAAGRFDLGFVGTQVFDTLGVDSFQALTAPMLLDSYAAEEAVIESGITERMLDGLDEVGVTGLAVLSGALRKPVAVEAPLLGPQDWRGVTFGVARSEGQSEGIRALSASPMQVLGDERDKALQDGSIDGFESSLLAYELNMQAGDAPYVAANVNLWPQTLAVVGNPDSVADLTGEQRGWLREAADDAVHRSTALADTDARSLSNVCEAGARIWEASETEIAALVDAFTPAYANLLRDPRTRTFIDQIQALKQETHAEPALAVPGGCTGRAQSKADIGSGAAPGYLNGVYRFTITKADARAAGAGDDPDYPNTNTVWMEDGNFRMEGEDGGFNGTYSVEGDRISFEAFDTVNTFRFERDEEGSLTLSPVQPMDPGDAVLMSTKPWTKIG